MAYCRVLVADDHPLIRKGFVAAIEQDPKFRIIAECGDGATALEQLRTLKPDIAILDISMPVCNGMQIVRTVQREGLQTLLVMLTMHKDEALFNEAMDLGVQGYVLKDSAVAELVECLHKVSAGRHFISRALSESMFLREQRRAAKAADPGPVAQLTEAERRILRLIAEHKTSKEIADALSVSHRTVENHRQNMCKKLGFQGPHKLVQFAIENKPLL